MSAPESRAAVLRRGVRSGVRLSAFLARILVPTSLATAALDATGWLSLLAAGIAPAMALLGLPGEAALALVTGAFLNIYAAIGVLAVIPLSAKQVNVLAIMILVAHNLVVETAVQKKVGMSAVLMLVVRLSTAAALGLAFASLIPEGAPAAGGNAQPLPRGYWPGTLEGAAVASGFLSRLPGLVRMLLTVVAIVFPLMIALEFLRAYGGMEVLARLCAPFLVVSGIPREAAFMVSAGVVFGLAYGAGVVVEEARAARMSRGDLFRVNVFLGTCHAWIEDTLLFVAAGASAVWILGFRVLVCVPAVRVWGAAYDRFARPA